MDTKVIYEEHSRDQELPIDLAAESIGLLTRSMTHSCVRTYGAYKRVNKHIKPISTPILQEFKVTQTIPYNPITTLELLDIHFGPQKPTRKFTQERISRILKDMESYDFLWPEERDLFIYVLIKNEAAIAFEDEDRGTLKEEYFSPYKISHVPHKPWQEKGIRLAPVLWQRIIDLLQLKMRAGVYEYCQSPYRSRWFCTWNEEKQKL